MNIGPEISVTKSSGNVFADLGLPHADEALTKAEPARTIGAAIAERRVTQIQAAELLGIDQPNVSALLRGRLTGFSIDRLLRFLTALDQDVEIVVKAKPPAHQRGQITVHARNLAREPRPTRGGTRFSRSSGAPAAP